VAGKILAEGGRNFKQEQQRTKCGTQNRSGMVDLQASTNQIDLRRTGEDQQHSEFEEEQNASYKKLRDPSGREARAIAQE
jgi:hypothetical protein